MSLLLGQPPKLCVRKPVFVRSSPNDFSSSSLQQTPPCIIIGAKECGADLGKLAFAYANNRGEPIVSDKKVPLDLVYNYLSEMKTIGSSHGWVATMNDDGIMHLQDDLNPFASHTAPKRIPLPPFVTLPNCKARFVTNVAMSSSSPEDEDCVVAVKFHGPQLSFYRPAQNNSEWINIKIADRCFYRSEVIFSKKDDMFCINGIGSHVIGSWDLREHKHTPKLQKLRYQKSPELTETEREILLSCKCDMSTHLVESRSTGETFLVKWYKKELGNFDDVIPDMQTKALMVFKIDEQGDAVYTKDIGDLCIFLSNSEPFCVPASSFPGLCPNTVHLFSFQEIGIVNLAECFNTDLVFRCGFSAPYYIPPQKID
ncbi:uncharacterized protein LOC110226765 [Arabidopsis lyrata subsp. lyrata]|uniref:uncharacterized protein LOC110226140 n=1 Tax=Arabidopsis lyrata subsp. lyrata TaxID=81972 RepID=UPI000A29D0CA|nr:uncharacterized protein LOC110226140 [Arabidopsis lyrata subsp. lyrata]XP_020875058.1 uncharacterized protein LOC110226765 [Arabidopsis lyrata subsp. lyrata]|eukprot:XP_020872452.1 uncharacterized protein LOC110226140 [Arabidopsis lyrata subsp. lyrata]